METEQGSVLVWRNCVGEAGSVRNPVPDSTAQKLRAAGGVPVIVSAETRVLRIHLGKAAMGGSRIGLPGEVQPLPVQRGDGGALFAVWGGSSADSGGQAGQDFLFKLLPGVVFLRGQGEDAGVCGVHCGIAILGADFCAMGGFILRNGMLLEGFKFFTVGS